MPTTAYVKPKDLSLDEVHEKMTVICHVSPDAGWPTLSDFLAGTKVGLTIGMYDFTAHHIIEGVLGAVQAEPRELTLVMQEGEALSGKPDDVKEEVTIDQYREALGDRFDYAPASIGKGHQFATAYHIKVAVRDSKAFWLSSGNWQTSNQPDHGIAVGETSWDLLLGHNREWNIMIENANLARQFEKYIQYDLKNAKADAAPEALVAEGPFFLVDEAVEERAPIGKPTYFAPLKVNRKVQVRPLLTPDNYQEHVLDLINTAERRILFQNQSLSLLAGDKNDDRFAALVDALLDEAEGGCGPADHHPRRVRSGRPAGADAKARVRHGEGPTPEPLPHQGDHRRRSAGTDRQPQLDEPGHLGEPRRQPHFRGRGNRRLLRGDFLV